ncbi:MAG: ribosome small subunit-dependent GTPase A [Pseudomonadota bacterium]
MTALPEDYFDALPQLGWKPHFAQQIDFELLDSERIRRVMAVQRAGLTLAPALAVDAPVPLSGRWFQRDAEERPTVGDWVVLDAQLAQIDLVLERRSLLKRGVAGRTSEVQLIGANVDVLLIVTSCNQDFNLSRIERYLALAYDSGAEPVVVLTKADLAEDPEAFRSEVQALRPELQVEVVNARDGASLEGVRALLTAGCTIALLGSSGVGKSTLLNSLAGDQLQLTAAIREDDGKGRHTTTHRSLHVLSGGGLVLDSPGIRELQLTSLDSGLEAAFDDIEALAATCRFRDCEHGAEPGCAVQAAIAEGTLDERRLRSFEKLKREEQYARETVAERHARVRGFGRMVKKAMDAKNSRGDAPE